MSSIEATSAYVVRGNTVAARRNAADAERELLERECAGQYQVVRLLGRGGMGAVYLARDVVLHRHVAIKVLAAELCTRPEARERFRREARLSAQLNHPGIVPLFGFGETPRVMYMVMRYVYGESLAERIRRERKIPPEDARAIVVAVARALEYAHRQGVVHRDLKPENILLDHEARGGREGGEGGVLLADFGVATRRSWDPVRSELRCAFGTPHFMSPEQAAGEVDIDGRSDLYGLGVLGYLMLAGRLPFDGASVSEVIAKQLAEAPPSLAALAPDAPRDLTSAIMRCLAKETTARWRHARDLVEALEARGRRWEWGRRLRAVFIARR